MCPAATILLGAPLVLASGRAEKGQPVTVRSRWPRHGQLPGLPKEGSQAWAFSSCLQSSQRPRAQEFTFHSLGFSSYGEEAKQLKRRLFFFFPVFFFKEQGFFFS